MSKTRIIIIVTIVSICVLAVGLGIYFAMTEMDFNKAVNKEKNESNIEQDTVTNIKKNFESSFNNDITGEYNNIELQDEENEIVYLSAEKVEIIPNKYDLDVQIPQINIEDDQIKTWNTEIKSIFQNKAANILTNSTDYTVYKVKYHTYINNNIMSLIIKANLKEGTNPEREIIKTYNYNLETKQALNLNDIINLKQLDKEEIQTSIKKEIESKKEYEKSLTDLGYETYSRDTNNKIYELENTTTYILGEDNLLYIIYCYGNNNYTSEVDLIII